MKFNFVRQVKNIFLMSLTKLLRLVVKKRHIQTNDILIISTAGLGDIFFYLPFAVSLSINIKGVKVYLLVREQFKDIQTFLPKNIEILSWNKVRYVWDIKYRIQFLNKLRNNGFAEVYNLTPDRGMLDEEITELCGARVRVTFSDKSIFQSKFNNLVTQKKYQQIIHAKSKNEYEKCTELLKHKSLPIINLRKSINGIASNENSNEYICVSPLPSVLNRSYPIENMRFILDDISKKYRIILLGEMKQRDLIDCLVNNSNIINTAGELRLGEIPELIKNAKLFIGLDSGLSHIAYAVGANAVIIMGGGDITRCSPKPKKNFRIIQRNLNCFDCRWNCIYQEKICLTEISPEQVILQIWNLINAES